MSAFGELIRGKRHVLENVADLYVHVVGFDVLRNRGRVQQSA